MTTPRSRAVSVTRTCVVSMKMSLILTFWSCWLEPSHMTCVLVGFSMSLLALIQLLTSMRHADNFMAAADASPGETLTYIWQSSAYWCSFISCRSTMHSISAVYNMYRMGPSTEPWGTPKNTG